MSMLLAEVSAPWYIYRRILMRQRRGWDDVIIEINKSRKGVIRVFIKDTPKGWWLALRILRDGVGDLYILKKVGYMDIPSKVLEIGFTKNRWSPIYEGIIDEELRKWRLAEDEQKERI